MLKVVGLVESQQTDGTVIPTSQDRWTFYEAVKVVSLGST
jgi:hypothetical protein